MPKILILVELGNCHKFSFYGIDRWISVRPAPVRVVEVLMAVVQSI